MLVRKETEKFLESIKNVSDEKKIELCDEFVRRIYRYGQTETTSMILGEMVEDMQKSIKKADDFRKNKLDNSL